MVNWILAGDGREWCKEGDSGELDLGWWVRGVKGGLV